VKAAVEEVVTKSVDEAVKMHMCKFTETERRALHVISEGLTVEQVGAMTYLSGILKRAAMLIGTALVLGMVAAAVWGVVMLMRKGWLTVSP